MAIQQRNMNAQSRYDGSQETYTLLNKKTEKLILNWTEIPTWMKDNVFITGGYRRQSNSYRECIKSLGYLHNESGM
jgi:adiponectin receptor